MIKKFDEFIYESKKDKESLLALLVKLLTEKPEIKLGSDKYPDEKGAYSLSGIKKYFKDNDKTGSDADEALYQIKNNRTYTINSLSAKNYSFNESVPYFYMNLDSNKVKIIKDKYESKSEEMAKPNMTKKSNQKKVTKNVLKSKKVKVSKSAKSAKSKVPERAEKK